MIYEQIIPVEKEQIEQTITVDSVIVEQDVPIIQELVSIIGADPYEGDYTITPSQSEQVLLTNGLRMTNNVTINPIPSNYGLITWNGSYLTVS